MFINNLKIISVFVICYSHIAFNGLYLYVYLNRDTISKNLDRKRQKINDHSEELLHLKSKINTLKDEKLQIDSDLQQRYKLEEDKATFLSENEEIKREIQVCSNQF